MTKRRKKWRLHKKKLRKIFSILEDKAYRRWLVRDWMKYHKAQQRRCKRNVD